MAGIDKQIKNAMLTGSSSFALKQFIPPQYSERQKQYFNTETRLFNEIYAKYSGDYIEAEVQGLNPAEPFEYTTVHLRFSDIVRSSSAISYEFDNYKAIDVAERQYTYLRIGAKIKAMGSTWLVINPDNISNELAKSIVQRCDAVWHYFDYYGNVCSEPMCFDRRLMKANDSDAQRAVMITKGYFDAKMQYNEASKQLFTNSRLILGSSAYRITGYSDFIQEFTEDINSVNLIQFDVRYEEPNRAIDDMENRVAGGLTFNWDISIKGTPTLKVGETVFVAAESRRTAEEKTEIVSSTEEHPISYKWSSSNEEIITVDDSGIVTGISEGTAKVICTLEQNTSKTAEFEITVAGDASLPHVSFGKTVPSKLSMFEEFRVPAVYFENGAEVPDAEITFTFENADEKAYTYKIVENMVEIKCWSGSVKPLKVTATHGDYSDSFEIQLQGI